MDIIECRNFHETSKKRTVPILINFKTQQVSDIKLNYTQLRNSNGLNMMLEQIWLMKIQEQYKFVIDCNSCGMYWFRAFKKRSKQSSQYWKLTFVEHALACNLHGQMSMLASKVDWSIFHQQVWRSRNSFFSVFLAGFIVMLEEYNLLQLLQSACLRQLNYKCFIEPDWYKNHMHKSSSFTDPGSYVTYSYLKKSNTESTNHQ